MSDDRALRMQLASAFIRASAMLVGDHVVADELEEPESLIRVIRWEKATLASEQVVEKLAAAFGVTSSELHSLAEPEGAGEQAVLRSIAERARVPILEETHGTLLERCWQLWDSHQATERLAKAPPPPPADTLAAAFEQAARSGPPVPAPQLPDLPAFPEPMTLAAYAMLTVELERSSDLDATLARHGLTGAELRDRVRLYWDSRIARDAAVADAFAALVAEARRDWIDL